MLLTHLLTRQARAPLATRAAGYGIPSVRIDGNDVLAVYAVTKAALDAARQDAFLDLLRIRASSGLFRLTGQVAGRVARIVLAAAAMALSSVTVVSNALRLAASASPAPARTAGRDTCASKDGPGPSLGARKGVLMLACW